MTSTRGDYNRQAAEPQRPPAAVRVLSEWNTGEAPDLRTDRNPRNQRDWLASSQG